MAHLVFHVSQVIIPSRKGRFLRSGVHPPRHSIQRRKKLQPRCLCNYSPSPSSSPAEVSGGREWGDVDDGRKRPYGEMDDVIEDKCLVRAYGWVVRRLVDDGDEIREVARIQAEAFHQPVALFDDVFFQFFQAEVLAGLMYTLRNSPPDRYACIVAEAAPKDSTTQRGELVGVVDVTVLRNQDVVQHLQGEEDEYLYISGIAVSQSYRRQKVATALLEACDVLSGQLGHRYLALRAYEDDLGARKLYSNAGYKLVGSDPLWVNWIGKRRRVLLVKKLQFQL